MLEVSKRRLRVLTGFLTVLPWEIDSKDRSETE